RAQFTNFKCKSWDKNFSDIEYCILKAVNRSYKYISIKVNLFKIPVTKIKVNIGLYKRVNGYKPFLYNITLDACKYFLNPRSNPVFSYFYEFIKDISNINHTCPYNHDVIMEKLSIASIDHRMTKILPFPEGDYLVEINVLAYDINRATVKVYATID
ncbi:hypothetical protein KR009_007479, partial [Drosophila setifemur]